MLTRTARVGLNTVANLARFVISMGVFFFLTPFIIRSVGSEDFGLWSLTFSTLGFLGLLDLGFGTSVVKYVAECRGSGDVDRRNRLLATLAMVYIGLGLLALLCVWVFSFFYADIFKIASSQRDKAVMLLWILAIRSSVLAMPLGLFRNILFGEQQIWKINLVQTFATLAYALSAWVLLSRRGSVIALAWLNLDAMILEHLIYVVLCIKEVDRLNLSPSLADRSLLWEAATFSISTFIVSVSSLILLRTDPIIISLFMPLSAVAIYSVALKIVENAHLLTKQFINVLGPLIAELKGQGDELKIRFVLINCSRFALLPSLMLAIPLAIFASDLLRLWVGTKFMFGGPSLIILLTAMTLAIPQMIASNVLTMTGHERVTARAAVASAAINLALSLLLVKPFGLEGVALGTLGATIAIDVGWIPHITSSVFGMNWLNYWYRILRPLALPIGLNIAVTLAMRTTAPQDHLLTLVWQSIPGALLMAAFYWRWGMEESEKQLFREKLFKRKPKPAEEPK